MDGSYEAPDILGGTPELCRLAGVHQRQGADERGYDLHAQPPAHLPSLLLLLPMHGGRVMPVGMHNAPFLRAKRISPCTYGCGCRGARRTQVARHLSPPCGEELYMDQRLGPPEEARLHREANRAGWFGGVRDANAFHC